MGERAGGQAGRQAQIVHPVIMVIDQLSTHARLTES